MGFDRGAVSYRCYKLPLPLPDDVLDRFAESPLPSFKTPVEGPIYGWAGRHLLDRQIDTFTAVVGGYLRLSLVEAEFKIPPALLKAEVAREELAQLAASDREFLGRRERSAIRKAVAERLLPDMPPQLKGTDFVTDLQQDWLLGTGLSDRQSDIFVLHFRQASGVSPIPLAPETAATERSRVATSSWAPVSYSSEIGAQQVADSPGMDFLTWLWFSAEAREGRLVLDGLPEVSLLFEGPLTFVMEGEGAHETVLRKGAPTLSPESSSCLRAGKKLSKAKLHLSCDGELWSFAIDETFAFRSVKLTDPEDRLDAISLFQDRMARIHQLNQLFYGLFDYYCALRSDASRWKITLAEMQTWVAEREA